MDEMSYKLGYFDALRHVLECIQINVEHGNKLTLNQIIDGLESLAENEAADIAKVTLQ